MTVRRALCLLLLLLTMVFVSTASAQFGGLKKKAARAVSGQPAQPAGPAAPVNVIVTPEVIDHYLAGLKARRAERDRIAHGNTPAGKYYAAQTAYQQHERRCEEWNQKRSEDYTRLVNQQKYDSAAAMMQVRDTSCERGMARPDEPDFQELAAAKGSEDTAAATGADMDVPAWASLEEWIPQLMNQMVNSPDQSSAQLASNFGRKPSEVEALKARKDEIAKALGIPPKAKPKPVEVQAAAPPPQMAPPAGAAASMASGDPACMQNEMNAQKATLEALGKRAEAAHKANDMQKAMAIADTLTGINMTIMRKCGMVK